jgi:hypothetical protein
MNTPVALIIFKRPDTTARVLDALRGVRPRTLFVIADAAQPTRADDAEKCAAARALIERIDWDCRVFKNYAEANLGLKLRVESGLNWVFGQVGEAIILEDDCVPHPSFFPFCEELLARYRDEPRVMGISGNNFHFDQYLSPYSYHFSRYALIWGWATWGRAWSLYDGDMHEWTRRRADNWLQTKVETAVMVRFWDYIFENTFKTPHTWDNAWMFATWLHDGLHITPSVNLVSNIGFRADGSHTLNSNDVFANMPARAMEFPLRHPPEIVRDADADLLTEGKAYSGRSFLDQMFRAMHQHIHSQK